MVGLILFVVSALPVFLLGKYIYNKDKNKEPVEILIKLFLGGILSCFLVLIVSSILGLIFPILSAEHETLNLLELIFYVFVGVALVEECCKWIFVYKISYNDKHFEEIYDMIVYSVFVALGFAFFENLLYVFQGGIGTGIMRAILAVPGHACDGVFMGYYLGLSKLNLLKGNNSLAKKNMILSILVPTLMHGIYDYCLFTGNIFFLIIFLIFVVCIDIKTIKRVKKIASENRKMKYEDNYCPICGHIVESDFCPKCGRKNN